MPASRRSRVSQRVMSLPREAIHPVAALRMPMIVSTSSAWPLPSTPAMPSTSPRRMSKRDVGQQLRPKSSTSVTPSSVSRTSSVTVDSSVSGDGSSEPTISSAS